MFTRQLEIGETAPQLVRVLPGYRRFRRGRIHNTLGQQRRRRDQNTTTGCLKLRLRYYLLVVDLNREPYVGAADQRRGPTNKTRLVRIAHISRIEEMIGDYFRQD